MSNRYSRIFHHISTNDLKRNREITIEKIEEEKRIQKKERTIFELLKRDWRREIKEGMTSTDLLSTILPASDLDNVINNTPTTDAGAFDVAPARDPGFSYDAMVGTSIKSSGSGSGSDGGFDIGDHVAFDGDGSTDGARWCVLKAVDTTQVDFMVVRAIVGNNSNGGETPDDSGEGLVLYYKTTDMFDYIPINYHPTLSDSDFQGGSSTIIPLSIGSYGDTMNDHFVAIPDYARTKDTRFLLYQVNSSAAGRDTYGITSVSYRRLTPLNVVVPLDSPEAISFVRVGTNEGDPKKRRKKVNDQLEASDQYTTKQMGKDFPGQGARLGDDDFRPTPFTPDDIIPSPIGKDEVRKSFNDFQKGDQTPEVIKTPEQIKAQNDEYLADLDNLLKQNEYNYADPEIIKIANKILKTDPKNEEAYFYKLGTQYETGDMEGVIKTTDAMIENNPDDTTGYEIRSSLRRDEGDLFGAIEDLEKAIELNPNETYYQDMMKELQSESDDDVQTKLDDYVTKSIPEPSKFVDDSKPTEAGRGITLTKWISRTDYRDMYPNTSVVDYLNSLPYGPSDFMTPNPKYPGAWDLNRKGYENYFLNGDLSALGNREGIPKPRHSVATPEPEPAPETDFSDVPKTSEQILADLDATIAKYSAEEQAAYAEMKRIALEFGLDVISLVGGLFTGGTSLAGSPTLSKLLLKLARKSGKGLFGKLVRNILRRTQKADVYSIDDIPDFIDQQTPKATPKPKPKPQVPAGDVGSIDPVTGLPRGGAGQNIGLPDVDPSISPNITRPDGKPFDPLPRQTDYSLDPIIKNIKKKKKKGGFKESTLFERIKSKPFFNPNDIKPTFPENPPPKLDPKTGMHPNYGKTAARYKKLDPASANAMPPTGDPETDAIVDKQRTKPRPKINSTFSKIKKIRKKN